MSEARVTRGLQMYKRHGCLQIYASHMHTEFNCSDGDSVHVIFTASVTWDGGICRAQVSLHVITMAFVVVLCTCGLLIPIMLYVFQVSLCTSSHV